MRPAPILAAGLALASCGRLKPEAAGAMQMDAGAPDVVAAAPVVTTPQRLWRLNNAQVENVLGDDAMLVRDGLPRLWRASALGVDVEQR